MIYSDTVWDHFLEPRHAGELAQMEQVGIADTPGSSAILHIAVNLQADRITDSRFMARGCPATIACASWLCDEIRGKSKAELDSVTAKTIADALFLPAEKMHCAVLAAEALERAMAAVPA